MRRDESIRTAHSLTTGEASWAVRLAFSAFGARILVLADDVALLPHIERYLPLGATAGSDGAPDRVLRLVGGPECVLYVGRRLVRRSRRIGPLLRALRRQLQVAVARFAREYVFVHAGVVAWQERAILIPGRSLSGKSTLVAALLDGGASYMSDEFALIDPRGWVQAYPRPLALRRPEGGRTRLHIEGAPERCLPIGAVLLTRFVPHRRWEPRCVSVGEGILGLLAHTVAARDTPRRAFEAVKRAIAGATILAGERGDAAETATLLLTGSAWQRATRCRLKPRSSPASGEVTPADMPRRVGARLGLAVHTGPPGCPGQIRRPDGRSFYFVRNRFDLNPHRAVMVARDKPLTAYHLLRMGYPVPEGRVFGRDEIAPAIRYALELGLPVFVKPSTGTNGRGVSAAYDESELGRALRFITEARRYPHALVQQKVEGIDHRLVVLDGEILAAYVRRPLSVTGDGERSIGTLLDAKLRSLRGCGRRIEIQAGDARIDARLRVLDLSRQSVLPLGETVSLLESANLSTGGEADDVSDRIHPDYRQLAGRIARDSGLRFIGIDLISVAPLAQQPDGYWILELNPAPSLDHFCAMGAAQERRVEAIFDRILRAMATV